MKRLALAAALAAHLATPALAAELSLEQRVDILERKAAVISDLLLRLDTLQREVQQLRGEVEVQNHAMDALKQRQRDLYLDVDQRLTRLSGAAPAPVAEPASGQAPQMPAQPQPQMPVQPQPQPPAANPPPPAPAAQAAAPPGDPAQEDARYQAAFKLLMQRRYDEAGSAFSEFLSSYPNGNYADNAQYWLAEASYVTRRFDAALKAFSKVVERYPHSAKVPDALLKTGFIQYECQAWAEARTTLEGVVRDHPNSTAARLAGKRLERMRGEGR
ncbi:MAG: tol-pal system protein YbgF [Candidatus Sedimenticola endophacoides]